MNGLTLEEHRQLTDLLISGHLDQLKTCMKTHRKRARKLVSQEARLGYRLAIADLLAAVEGPGR